MKKISLPEKVNEQIKMYAYYLIPIVALLAVAALLLVVWIPEIQKITTSRKKLEEKKGIKALLEKKVTDLKSLDEPELTGMNNRIGYILPSEKDPAWILMGISEVAAENNLSITSIQTYPGPISTPSADVVSNLEFLRVLVNLQGTIDGIKNFIATLSQSGRIYKVKELNLAAISQNQDLGQPYLADIEIKAFFQQYPQKLGKYEDAVSTLNQSDKNVYDKISSDQFKIKGLILSQSQQELPPVTPTSPPVVKEATSSSQTTTQTQ